MTTPGATPEATKLMQVLAKIQADLVALKAGASTQTLDNSAIEVTQSRGYIPIMQNGQEMHRMGRQPDGTITSVTVGSTNAPIVPSPPTCTPGMSTVTVYCGGFGSKQYLDFSHINVYVDGDLVDTLMKVPESTVIGPLTYTQHSFELSSVNLAGVESAHTVPVYATPNQVVSNDIAQGMITALQIANNAVTQAKIAAGAVTSQQIADATITASDIAQATITGNNIAAGTVTGTNMVANTITSNQIAANAIQAVNIAAGAVQAASIAAGAISVDKLAANSVTTAALQAQAVTALNVAANAIAAGNIQAGVIDSTKLAAQIILASTSIIAGNPTGQRIQLDPSGLTQWDSHGNLALDLGNTPGGNSLTVIDPANPANALASLGSDGSMTMTGISINGTASLNGVDLVNFLNNLPDGMVAQGYIANSAIPYTTSEVGMFEISFMAVPGRAYQLLSDPFYGLGFSGGIGVRYTTDGSVPKVSSTLLGSTMALANSGNYGLTTANGVWHQHYEDTGPLTGSTNDGHNHNIAVYNTCTNFNKVFNAPTTWTQPTRVRFLFTIMIANTFGISSSVSEASGSTNMNLYAFDIGQQQPAIGGNNSGSGTSSATAQYTVTYTPTYCAYYGDATGTTNPIVGLQQGKLGTTNYMSMIGFNYSTIASTLSGATIVKVELYLYSSYWAISSGGYACVGTHNATDSTAPATYSYATRDVLDQIMKKPQSLWLQLPLSVGTAFQNGTAKGIVLDSRISHAGTSNFGTFNDLTAADHTTIPTLRITYTK